MAQVGPYLQVLIGVIGTVVGGVVVAVAMRFSRALGQNEGAIRVLTDLAKETARALSEVQPGKIAAEMKALRDNLHLKHKDTQRMHASSGEKIGKVEAVVAPLAVRVGTLETAKGLTQQTVDIHAGRLDRVEAHVDRLRDLDSRERNG